MKFLLLGTFILFPILSSFSQEIKPILDPSIACSYAFGNPNNPVRAKINFFHIVETMPEPKIPTSSIEKLLKKNVSTKGISSEKTMIQFLVNCEGKAGDYQFLTCESKTRQFCKEVLSVFQNTVEWTPGIQKGTDVDVLLRIEVEIKNGQFEVRRF